MASPTQWRWVWVNYGSWWWTGRPGVLQSTGLQRVRHNWATEVTNWTSAWNAGDPGSISGSGRSLEKDRLPTPVFLGFPYGSAGKESTCNAGDLGVIPGLGRSPGVGNGNPLQYSGLENSMDYIVHGVAKSWTWLSDFHFSSPGDLPDPSIKPGSLVLQADY